MVAALLGLGCTGGRVDDAGRVTPPQSASTASAPSATTTTTTTTTPPRPGEAPTHPDLRLELLEMQRVDQQERAGEGLPPGTKLGPPQDFTRAERLKVIIADHGGPTFAMVGTDGATAAWLVAQHADHDVAFQRAVVDLLAQAVADSQADPTELAYLIDRVAVNSGAAQSYGIQVRCRGGEPTPATPLTEADRVDQRAEVGLGPLADYYEELAMMCAQEEAEGQQPAS
jgi:hypothetical protein